MYFDDLTYVAWLEEPERRLTFERSSLWDLDLETPDTDSLSESFAFFLTSLPGAEDRLLSSDISVSGGLGGVDAFLTEPLRELPEDFVRRSSSPASVGSGVTGASRLDGERSSRLITASLLCALLKEGYGSETRLALMADLGVPVRISLVEPARSLLALLDPDISLLPRLEARSSSSLRSRLLLRCFRGDDRWELESPPSPDSLLLGLCERRLSRSFSLSGSPSLSLRRSRSRSRSRSLRSDFDVRRCLSRGRSSREPSPSRSLDGMASQHE